MRRWALWAALAAALVGAAVAVLSTTEHLRLMREGLEQRSFCAISETINCDVVNASSYSEFLGVPIAWWGLCFYLLVGGMALVGARSKKDRRSTVAIAWFLTFGSLAYSAYLAYIAGAVLGVWCIECLTMYAVNIALFLFLFAALRVRVAEIPRFFADYLRAVFGKPSNLGFAPRLLPNAVAGLLVFLIGWGAIAAISSGGKARPDEATLGEKLTAFSMQSLYTIEPNPEWPVWGNPKAPVTIVEFSEFQCPFCRVAAFSVKPYLQEFRNDIRFYFVNYPLDNACNDSMPGPMHAFACSAAKAGICAQKLGDFWGFHDDLFRNQQKLSQELILSLADKRGWNRDEFAACIASPETDKRVKADLAAARKIYVSGTPTIFLNERKIRYWRDPKFLQAVVREEIKRAKHPPKAAAARPAPTTPPAPAAKPVTAPASK
jgi:protein-disulfide isomerase/uncharacterized membrane protein